MLKNVKIDCVNEVMFHYIFFVYVHGRRGV
jgi:hypothetical protein